MRLRVIAAVLALGLAAEASAGGRKGKRMPEPLPAEVPVFRVAYPDGLAVEETMERTRVKNFDGTSQSETTRQVSDLLWTAVPGGGWQLRSTLRTATVSRNGAPASDPVAELMIGLPVTFHLDPGGTITAVTGFESLAARLDGLGLGGDLRALLDRTLDPAVLAAKAKADLDSRLGVLAGQPLSPGLRIERPAGGTTAVWTLAGTAPCPPGQCVEATSELPLSAGTLDLGAGISATLDSGTVRGTLHVDPATSLPWREVRDDERVMSVSISGRTTQGTVIDHVERTWTIAEP